MREGGASARPQRARIAQNKQTLAPRASAASLRRLYVSAWNLAARRIGAESTATAGRRRFEATTRRVGGAMVGAVMIGLGVAFFVHSNLGLAPYDVWLSAVSKIVGVSLGQAAVASALLIYALAFLLGQRVGISSLLVVLVNGIAVDFFVDLVRTPESLGAQIFFVGLGITSLAFGVALMVEKARSGGPVELLTHALMARGSSLAIARTVLEVVILLLGVLGGGTFGVATVVAALAIGPMLRRVLAIVEDHRLGRRVRLTGSAHFAPEEPAVTVSST